ncbi:MAG: SRPBCC domain-containing protein [Bacteroidales bacterium]|nr:SRPBCC domain-containing protein [Bacteroidales bacterium]
MKKEFKMEFVVNTSPKLIYVRINSPSGLSEWFADDVNSSEDIYTFKWDGSVQLARRIENKTNEFVRFTWLNDKKEIEESGTFFEFRIQEEELTGDVSLMITDYSEEDELEENQNLWEQQISQLKQSLGL